MAQAEEGRAIGGRAEGGRADKGPDDESPTDIVIHPPTVSAAGAMEGFVGIDFPLEGLGSDFLRFQVNETFADFIDDSCDAAVVALLPVAMKELGRRNDGACLRVAGPLSASLDWRLRLTAMPVLERLIPTLAPIEIAAKHLLFREEKRTGAVLTGLSCGVDSLVTCQDYLLRHGIAPGDRVTHFLFNEVGAHGATGDSERFATERWARVKAAAHEMERPIIRVRSNMPDLYRPYEELDFMQTMPARQAAVALLLQRGIRRYLLASGLEWEGITVRENPWTGGVDPILLAAFSTADCEQAIVGLEYDRVEKTRIVSRMELATRYLDVCVSRSDINCGKCAKCLRTALVLEILGKLDDFAGVFDLDAYQEHRTRYIGEVLVGGGVYSPPMISLMGEEGFKPPVSAHVDGRAREFWEWVPEGVRQVIRPLIGKPRR